jgi:hypothetical protein
LLALLGSSVVYYIVDKVKEIIMNLKELKPIQALNKAFLKVKPSRADIELFKNNLITLLNNINDKESEEFHKNLISDLLKNTYYNQRYFINTNGRNDLVIHNGKDPATSIGVIIEAKRPTNTAEMITTNNLNAKAFQELVLYYLRERITHKNLEVKHLIITNINEWFIFDANLFDRIFAQNKSLVKQFTEFEGGRLAETTTAFFYKDIAKPFIDKIEVDIEFTYFNIQDFKDSNIDDRSLIALLKLLSPEHLLKLPFINDSNSLDKRFYGELLHIIGLTETKEGSKKLIGRNKEGERHTGTILEDTIIQLDSLDKLSRLEKIDQFGKTQEERLFNVALELSITWINRILFLKLLEAQLITYHKGNQSYSYLNHTQIKNYDDLNSLFFQVLARKYDERNEDVKKIFEKVPYLNSSLFEPTELEQVTLFISNLKDDKIIPIFSQTVIKDKQGKKRTGYLNTLEYLFAFLDAYNFGAEDSDLIQEENKTLINASVLGLIFEKINGYKDGSFFTPGFITMYMCRETIRKAVVQKFNETKKWDCKDIDDLYDKIEDRKEANNIINSIKICDPAVGSGHFLVSALNEIIAIKNDLKILQDRSGKRLKEYQIEVVNDELMITDEDGQFFEYRPNNTESQRIQEALFHEKQTIIESCLFGVDINPNSVKICRLRLWIELLKNAYYKNTTELETLPNIDINIKCGNSLISRFAIDTDIKDILKKNKINISDYRNAVDTYRNATSKTQKREMENLITKIKSDVSIEITNFDPIKIKLEHLKQRLSFQQNELFDVTKKEQVERDKNKKILEQEIVKLDTELEDIKSNKIFENAFEWRFEFPEVLNDAGDFIGFDVVIGNPPYGVYFSQAYKEYLVKKYEFLVDRIRNSFLYFIGLGITLTAKNGILNCIVPNEILFQIYMTKARKYFLTEKKVLSVINVGDNVFEDAIVSSAILEIKNKKEENYSVLMADIRDKVKERVINSNNLIKVSSELLKINFNQIYVINSKKSNLVNKLMSNFSTLESISATVSNGISTSCDKIHIINSETIKKYKIENSVAKKTIRGSNFNKYWIDENIDDFLIYITNKTDIEKIPNTMAYLEKNKSLLINSSVEKKQEKRDWYVLFRAREENNFFAPKILVRQTADRIISAFDNDLEFYPIDTINIVKLQDNDINFNLSMLGILNSKLVTFFYQEISQEGGRVLAQVKPSRVKAVPIPKISNTKQISKIVTSIMSKKKKGIDTSYEENKIDQLVYQLYGLTEEEINIVEGKESNHEII